MPLLGQASGGWLESSSALRLLNVQIRNSNAVATDDCFTQANPVGTTASGTVSAKLDPTKIGVLSGSVAFSRPDAGSNFVGGAGTAAIKTALNGTGNAQGYSPLGMFINSALGNPFENTPAVASGVTPYTSGMGTFGDQLYETVEIGAGVGGVGNPLVYITGAQLIASLNGFLMPRFNGTTSIDVAGIAAEQAVKGVASTTIGILKLVPDAVQTELVFDQRI